MISGIETAYSSLGTQQISDQMELVRMRQTQNVEQVGKMDPTQEVTPLQVGDQVQEGNRVTFGKLIGELVDEVDAKGKTSASELKKVMTGEVDNIHQSMVAMQEASVAFSLMVEVRNKLMESYQEVMRMQV